VYVSCAKADTVQNIIATKSKILFVIFDYLFIVVNIHIEVAEYIQHLQRWLHSTAAL